MRELGLLGTDDGLDNTFAEIRGYAANCRFANCTHTAEPGCAVLLAVGSGILGEDRYQSYLKLKKEAEYHDLSLVGKRRKDRSFGRFMKSAQKNMKK
jgi:ribosome biogenesis GTPase